MTPKQMQDVAFGIQSTWEDAGCPEWKDLEWWPMYSQLTREQKQKFAAAMLAFDSMNEVTP